MNLVEITEKNIDKESFELFKEGLYITNQLAKELKDIDISFFKEMIYTDQIRISKKYYYCLYKEDKAEGFISFSATHGSKKDDIKIIEVGTLYVKDKNKGVGSFILTEFEKILKSIYKNKEIRMNLSSNEIKDPLKKLLTDKFYLKNGYIIKYNDLELISVQNNVPINELYLYHVYKEYFSKTLDKWYSGD